MFEGFASVEELADQGYLVDAALPVRCRVLTVD